MDGSCTRMARRTQSHNAGLYFMPPTTLERTVEGRINYRYNPRHRWCYFPDMTLDEVLVFKTHDSEPGRPGHVPHSAFSDPTCSPGVAPRASTEMRGIAYWFS